MTLSLAEHGNDLLYRYLPRDRFQKRHGFYHPDPFFEEYTYGEGGAFSTFVWNNIDVGSRIFFHAVIGSVRYLTAMYYISDFFPGAVGRLSEEIKKRYRNPHLRPDLFPRPYGGGYDSSIDQEVKEAYESGIIYTNVDILLIGDPSRSLDIRKAPIVLDKNILSRLSLQGKPIKWDIVDSKGKPFDQNKCIQSCLRPPRVLSKSDGDLLENLIKNRAKNVNSDITFNKFIPIDSLNASKIQLDCSSEEEIEDYIIRHLYILGSNLKFKNNQYKLKDESRVDILAEDYARKIPVIIEIKKGSADDSTLTQICSYLGQYKKQYPMTNPEGIIVCADASYRMKNACEHLGIEIYFYGDILLKD